MNRACSVFFLVCFLGILPCLEGCRGKAAPNLIEAVSRGDVETVRHYLEGGGDPNTDLGIANEHWTLLRDAAHSNQREIVDLLLKHGADLEHRDSLGLTPVVAAACAGHADMVEYLTSKGARLDVRDMHDGTILVAVCWCVFHPTNTTSVVDLLLAKGVDINAVERTHMTALTWAAFRANGPLILHLLARGADANVETTFYSPKSQANALLMYIRSGGTDTNVVKTLAQVTKNLSCKAYDGKTALDTAHERHFDDVAQVLEREQERRIGLDQKRRGL
jgi:ankyrin repeat protein